MENPQASLMQKGTQLSLTLITQLVGTKTIFAHTKNKFNRHFTMVKFKFLGDGNLIRLKGETKNAGQNDKLQK